MGASPSDELKYYKNYVNDVHKYVSSYHTMVYNFGIPIGTFFEKFRINIPNFKENIKNIDKIYMTSSSYTCTHPVAKLFDLLFQGDLFYHLKMKIQEYDKVRGYKDCYVELPISLNGYQWKIKNKDGSVSSFSTDSHELMAHLEEFRMYCKYDRPDRMWGEDGWDTKPSIQVHLWLSPKQTGSPMIQVANNLAFSSYGLGTYKDSDERHGPDFYHNDKPIFLDNVTLEKDIDIQGSQSPREFIDSLMKAMDVKVSQSTLLERVFQHSYSQHLRFNLQVSPLNRISLTSESLTTRESQALTELNFPVVLPLQLEIDNCKLSSVKRSNDTDFCCTVIPAGSAMFVASVTTKTIKVDFQKTIPLLELFQYCADKVKQNITERPLVRCLQNMLQVSNGTQLEILENGVTYVRANLVPKQYSPVTFSLKRLTHQSDASQSSTSIYVENNYYNGSTAAMIWINGKELRVKNDVKFDVSERLEIVCEMPVEELLSVSDTNRDKKYQQSFVLDAWTQLPDHIQKMRISSLSIFFHQKTKMRFEFTLLRPAGPEFTLVIQADFSSGFGIAYLEGEKVIYGDDDVGAHEEPETIALFDVRVGVASSVRYQKKMLVAQQANKFCDVCIE